MSDPKSIDEIRKNPEEELKSKKEKRNFGVYLMSVAMVGASLFYIFKEIESRANQDLAICILIIVVALCFFGAKFSSDSGEDVSRDTFSPGKEYRPLVEVKVPVIQEENRENKVISTVLSQARFELLKIEKALLKIKSQKFKDPLLALYSIAQAVVKGVGKNPETYNESRRLLTYYIPSLARLAQTLEQVEGSRRISNEKLQQVYETLVKLQPLFEHYLDAVNKPLFNRLNLELDVLDVDIKTRLYWK